MYAATLAPSVTFWDAGEFIAAAHGLGIPHPPGTPLYVALARAWSALLPTGTAVATNLLSAVCTAAAAGIAGTLVSRWTGRAWIGFAAALCAGAMASVWASATETEVYATSLLLSMGMLAAGDRAGTCAPEAAWRWVVLLGFAMCLAPAVHLSALVAAPAAIVLAGRSETGTTRWLDMAALGAVLLTAAGIGTVRPLFIGAGMLGLLALAIARPAVRRPALASIGVIVLAASALLILLVRARHDPVLNQGNPSTFAALLDVVAREQYAVPGLWPRRAPLWLQFGNLIEYLDWQIALGLAPGVAPAPVRTPFTILFMVLGAYGALRHSELHRRSWLGIVVLLVSASIGVVLYLNLRAGPSFGYGILPDDAPREPRERDYFFALAFFTWGLWSGVGAVLAAAHLARGRLWPGVALAALPIALNWRAMDRGGEPEASIPRVLARELLGSAPANAVLFVWGDNDSYPLWYLQQVEGVRPDVTVITIPLLGAEWYRAELHRRHGLVDVEDLPRWRGEIQEVAALADRARALGRPVSAAVTLPGSHLRAMGDRWVLHGLAHVEADSGGVAAAGALIDRASAESAAARVADLLVDPRPRDVIDPTPWSMRELLRCPGLAAAVVRGTGDSASLDLLCNRR